MIDENKNKEDQVFFCRPALAKKQNIKLSHKEKKD
jgi:hypothetical protein